LKSAEAEGLEKRIGEGCTANSVIGESGYVMGKDKQVLEGRFGRKE